MRRASWMVAGALCAAPTVAGAFCGTFVAAPGTEVTNQGSRVIYARDGGVTTLTLASDFRGDTSDFAMIIPVPEVIGPEDVTTVDPALVDFVDQYTVPRVVAYTCEDVLGAQHDAPSLGCVEMSLMVSDAGEWGVDGDGLGEQADGSVTVESQFRTAEYEIVVLSATGGGGLAEWLDANGFVIPDGGEGVLQEYVQSGSYFLAARVAIDGLSEDREWLSPLQLRYESASLGLPIRIGTISAEVEQEVTVYAFTSLDEGEVRIANYPELTIEDECMWQPAEGETLADFYEEQVAEAIDANGAGWLREYSWDIDFSAVGVGSHCDPCTVPQPLTSTELTTLGATTYAEAGAHVTRLRMRYLPSEATEDLVLYTTGERGVFEQMRFVQYAEELEFAFPVCGEGFVDDPGTCPSPAYGSACAVPGPGGRAVALWLTVALASMLRRRR